MSQERIQKQKEPLPETQGSRERVSVNWCYPDIEGEREDIMLVAGHFKDYALDVREAVAQIHNAIHEGQVRALNEKIWSELQNTDSYEIKFGQVEEAKRLAVEGGKDINEVEKILQNMKDRLPIQSPVIVIKKDGTPYLISGNTRLMLARALGETPQVVIGNMK